MPVSVSIVGITGAVGRKMLEVLETSNIPVSDLNLWASERSKNAEYGFRGRSVKVKPFSSRIKDDIVFFAVSEDLAREFASSLAGRVKKIIDNSSAFRLDTRIPLIIPSINGEKIKRSDRLIANPNCSTIEMLLALDPIRIKWGLSEITVTTLQSVSGSGWKSISNLYDETREFIGEGEIKSGFYPYQIAFNIIPFIGKIDKEGRCSEEYKMMMETKKIFGDPSIAVNATTLRVPVFYSHFESIHFRTKKDFRRKDIIAALKKNRYLRLLDESGKYLFPMPVTSTGSDIVDVGRIRADEKRRTAEMVISADNLRVGAATNAVRIAEYIFAKGLI
mgnify:CR=1 FL=1